MAVHINQHSVMISSVCGKFSIQLRVFFCNDEGRDALGTASVVKKSGKR